MNSTYLTKSITINGDDEGNVDEINHNIRFEYFVDDSDVPDYEGIHVLLVNSRINEFSRQKLVGSLTPEKAHALAVFLLEFVNASNKAIMNEQTNNPLALEENIEDTWEDLNDQTFDPLDDLEMFELESMVDDALAEGADPANTTTVKEGLEFMARDILNLEKSIANANAKIAEKIAHAKESQRNLVTVVFSNISPRNAEILTSFLEALENAELNDFPIDYPEEETSVEQ